MTDLTANSTSGPDSMYSLVAGPYVFFAILGFIISTTLIILIFSYLNNVSLVKECVLVYLYKDVVIMFILSNCYRLITIIIPYSHPSGLGISPTIARAISFAPILLLVLLLLFINTINVVKCYILKSKVLDPPMPWGDDDVLGINTLRLAYSIFTIVLGSVMYVLGLHPKVPLYYVLVEHHLTEPHFPEHSYILAGLCVALCITSTITGVVAKVYEEANKQLLGEIIAQQINYSLVIFPTILVMLLILTVYLVDVFEVFTFMNLLEIMYVVVSLLYIIAPTFVFYKVHPVRSHAVKLLKNKWEDAFILKIYVTPVLITVIMYPSLFILYQLLDI
jgi:hypothetical protein